MTKKQLALYVKINFLILALFVVLSLMVYLRKKERSFDRDGEKELKKADQSFSSAGP